MKPTAASRLKQDYMRLKKDPVPYITAEPLPSNILEWHFVVKGPEDTPYLGGYYHGKLLFPRDFPFRPPAIYIITPNGRFKPNTRLCLSISDFHPDSWNPAWSVATILTGLLSFMLESTPTLGSIDSTSYEKERFARRSITFNIRNETFRELFPDICNEMEAEIRDRGDMPEEPSESEQRRVVACDSVATQWNNLGTNVIVVLILAIFALIVNYIVKSMLME
ncbi:ubiquitin-conjugating enzyme E2 J2 isoform X2 [Phlebotomus argentipes]|uniref:ubiquitin-conjugating enzyme E2 J2 isoform X2 n=1 Tax=Phlebotomus argentipes TaxID=94469 RepID=UPI0028933B32|nr:ubiquitin-conjugating enzyme E2 J2 isoform X2 [Phlebotomus argentipes]